MRRHFGEELYLRMCEPVVGGLFMADTEELSLTASFPRLAGRETTSAQGAPRPKQGGPAAPGSPRDAARPGSPPHPAATLEGGLGQIVPALLERLPAGSLRLGRRALSLSRQEAGEEGGYRLSLDDGEDLFADAVVVALPAPAASKLLADLDPGLAAALGGIAYAPAATVHLAWSDEAVTRPPDCPGFFVPRTTGSPVVAASFVSVKYPERTPAGQVVVRVFLGGALHSGVLDRSDGQLVQSSADLLAPLLGAKGPPLWCKVWRLPSSMPQRKVGHPALAATLTARIEAHPGLAFAGGPLGAYGLPDSITEGEGAAARVIEGIERLLRQAAERSPGRVRPGS
jgi:oxygen-dependent protoporphyrinogen oxidase